MAQTRSGPAATAVGSRRGRLTVAHRQIVDAIAAELVLRDPDGRQLLRIAEPEQVARDIAERILDTSRAWQEHLGPMYDVDGVRVVLAHGGRPISKQAVSKRKNLLALTTGSGRVVYPQFQFVGRTVVPGLADVLSAVPESLVSRWTLASWLVSAEPDLEGDRPIDVLRQGHRDRVADVARRWADSLAA